MRWIFITLLLRFVGVDGDCSLPTELHGTWISTNFGNVTIQSSSPQLSMTQTFTGSTASTTTFNCLLIDGEQYILQSNDTVTVFSGTTNIYIYMCIQFTQTSTTSYIYYLNSDMESGLNNYRLVGLPISTTVTQSSQVCTATLDTAEYNVMINAASSGYELGTVECPEALLGNFLFTYTNGGTTFCDTVNATVNTCNNQSLTGILANDSSCSTADPFYSTGGVLGCIASLVNSATDTYYATLYNGDGVVDNTATYRFSCVAITQETNGTVFLSVKPTVCDSAQSSTTAPSPGALMVLNPDCVPSFTSGETDYTVLIVLLCVFFFLIIIVVIIVLLCYFRYKKKKKEKKREKNMLVSEDHPLGEVSIALDTPATMEPVSMESRHDVFKSPRRKKGFGANPMGESSMNLDFLGGHWPSAPKSPSRMGMDPFTEMETGAIVPLSPRGSKTARSLKSRQGSFVGRPYLNGDARKPLAITDSVLDDRNGKPLTNGGVVAKRGPREMTRANSMIKAPSIRSARSIKAPSLYTESLRSNGAVVRVSSIKGRGNSKSTSRPDKLTRSATSTRIGSVTRKKMMLRANTVIVPTKTEDGPGEEKPEMDDFMSGEVSTVIGSMSARSEGGRSKKSTKSTKSKAMTARSAAPSRSSKRKSATTVRQTSVLEMTDTVTDLPESEMNRSFMSKDLSKESFRTARELKDMRIRAKKPAASKERKSATTVRQASVLEMTDTVTDLPESEMNRSFMSKDLSKESFRTARELKDMRIRAKKPAASKGPWK